MATKYWVSPTDSTWETAGGWSPAGVPAPTDDPVFIGDVGTCILNTTTGTASVSVYNDSLQLANGVSLTGTTLDVDFGGELGGSGTYVVPVGGSITNMRGTVTCDNLHIRTSEASPIPAGRYGVLDTTIFEPSAFTLDRGDYVFSGNLTYNSGVTVSNTGGNPVIETQGDLTVESGVTWAAGDGQLILSGPEDQDLTAVAVTLDEVYINKTSGTVTCQSDLDINGSLILQGRGSFDFNTNSPTVTGNLICAGPNIVAAGLSGINASISGRVHMYSTGVLTLDSASPWTMTLANQGNVVSNATVKNCTAATNTLQAGNSVDATNNTGVVFVSDINYLDGSSQVGVPTATVTVSDQTQAEYGEITLTDGTTLDNMSTRFTQTSYYKSYRV